MNVRSILYAAARWMGDYRAAKRGRVGQRIARRGIGKLLGAMLRGLFRRRR